MFFGELAQLARAPRLQRGGQGFESLILHQYVFSPVYTGFFDILNSFRRIIMNNIFSTFLKEKYGIAKYAIGIYQNRKTNLYNYDNQEIYDIASITKLFTLKILYDLKMEHKIDLNAKITTYLKLANLDKDTTILDLIKMKDTIRTDKKLSDAESKEEFLNILFTAKIVKKNVSEYNDIGFCLLGILIEKITQKSLIENFRELFLKLGLKNTWINPSNNYQVYGNGDNDHSPHDLKTRIAGGITGASGIFSNVMDLLRVGKLLIEEKFFDKESLKEIFSYNFIDHKRRNRTYAGLYKYTEDYRCYVPKNYSKYSLAHQGYTGATLIVDLKEKVVNVLLFDAILKDTNEKSENFFDGYYKLQEITARVIL